MRARETDLLKTVGIVLMSQSVCIQYVSFVNYAMSYQNKEDMIYSVFRVSIVSRVAGHNVYILDLSILTSIQYVPLHHHAARTMSLTTQVVKCQNLSFTTPLYP